MKSEQTTVPLYVEVNENIYNCMQDFLASNPQWNKKMLVNASMSLFLMKNHKKIEPEGYQACSQTYLRSVCIVPEQYSQN